MASVRFICGTQTQHTRLEARLSQFLGTEATILYSSCFDANGGVFEVLFGAEDAIVSDELNHASIIDGIRLSKAARYRYRNADLADLRAQLTAAREAGARRVLRRHRRRLLHGRLRTPRSTRICDLADEFEAMVLVDDSHAVGFVGDGGRGTPELLRRAGPRRHPHRHPRQGPRRSIRRATSPATARSSTCCASARGPTSSRTRWPRRWWPGRSPPSTWSPGRREARETLRRNAALFRELMDAEGLRPAARRRTPSCR